MKRKSVNYTFESPKLFLFVIIVILCVGIGIVIGASVYISSTLDKIDRYTVVMGTVVDYKITEGSREDSDGISHKVDMYAEIAEFEVDGETYKVTNGISSSSGVKKIGEQVNLAYNPDNPSDCIFITSNNAAGIAILVVLGGIFTCVGIGMLIWYIKQYRAWKQSMREE